MKNNTQGDKGQGEFHSFNVDEATKYGIPKAVLIYNLRFWLNKNRANRKHWYDGFYWTYNSSSAFAELFPYLAQSSIRMWLQELEEQGVIKSGNYNKAGYDKTKWYTIKGEFEAQDPSLAENHQPIGHFHQSIDENQQPIPDINTDINNTAGVKTPASSRVVLNTSQEEEEEQDIVIDSDVDEDGNPKVNSFGRYRNGKSIHVKPPKQRNEDAMKLAVWFARQVNKEIKPDFPVQVQGYPRIKELIEDKKLKPEKIKELLQAHLDRGLSNKDTANIFKALSPQAINNYFNE